MQGSSGRSAYPPNPCSQTNPIDLTLDDDDGDCSSCDRKYKRACSSTRSFNATCDPPSASSPARFSYQTGLSPAMSSSSLQPDNRPPSSTLYSSPYNASHAQMHNGDTSNIQLPPIPAFHGPSNPAAFFKSSSVTPVPPALAPASHSQDGSSAIILPQPQQPPQYLQGPPHEASRQVIDLTNSPSPPPAMHRPPPQVAQGALPQNLPPKTPVCIGQIPATALVLYPIGYLLPQPGMNMPDMDWAPVRLSYEHNAQAKPGCTETIHIRTPNSTSPSGDVVPGEGFAVVEQKAASVLGPMLGKGLIRLDGRVRRGMPNLPIIPLTLLVYTPKGNITVVGNYLHQNGLFLDHPTLSTDVQRIRTQYYYNPHNPPPGGHRAALLANARPGPGYMGPGGSNTPRWNTVSGKSVEVQRSQVDELFKSLRDGEELLETEPPPEIATTLYPHQKKALTFMLERERELLGFGNKFSSLWQQRHNPLSGQISWYHLVTQREVFEEPHEAKGSILADDMGLGKTISCVALLAATLESAQKFAATPLETPVPPPRSLSAEPGLSASHFAGSVWGMPQSGPSEPTTAKGKKAARDLDKLEAEYVRACRIKTRSRATLIVCPLSTVVNWEDQFREHWRGEVTVVGGAGGTCVPITQPVSQQLSPSPWSTPTSTPADVKDVKPAVVKAVAGRVREGRPLRVYVYHGNSRRPDPAFLADFDAVITTYSTLAVEFSKQSKSAAGGDEEEEDEDGNSSDGYVEIDERGNPVIKLPKQKKAGKKRKKNGACTPGTEISSPLQSVYWFRVVLDEAHSIKEITTVACRACCDILADRRLCLTGTPVQNKLDDVYALLKFLRLEPFDDKAVWTEFIGTPVKYGQPLGVARLQTIMKCITLRRTKESKAENGQKILTLPPRRDELRYLKFDQQEQALYDQFFTESKAEFNELSNKNEVMKNYELEIVNPVTRRITTS
ncbi:hypothetical protein NM688_g6913 [Phlebia brevispora]|uniref:Uncharacterized protein n=1 Tax=Phlebia brevispora TaxID=194682 RepID=A0ACC1SAZ7_9APHY|nr:hypothetical protein NM688_g6913 [Phlebia brevispora]